MLTDVQGQPEAVRFLSRVVEGHLTSPLLLVGPEGVGRRFSVLAAADEEFALTGSDHHRVQILKGVHPDVVVVQPEDDKDIGVDVIRDLVDLTSAHPVTAPTRYVIVDGADRLTTAAANALLKTLEEPSTPTRFFLLAEKASAVLPTIRSRCGLVRFRPLSESFVQQFLLRHVDQPEKATVYARLSEGSVGRGLQYMASGRLTLRDEMLSLIKIGLSKDLSSLFAAVNKVGGLRLGVQFLEHILRDMVLLAYEGHVLTNADIAKELRVLRDQLGAQRLDRLVDGFRHISRLSPSMTLASHVKAYLANAFAD